MKKVICIVGYNNTRINDVRVIASIIKQKYHAYSLLIKDEINENDKKIVDYTIETNLVSTDINVIENFLFTRQLKIVGVLPFSDRGVILGASLARSYNLPHDLSNEYAEASVHKNKFRELEKETIVPSWYKKVNSKVVNSYSDAKKFLNGNKKMFIKPTSEGNSRGCMAIYNEEDLQEWDSQFKHYYKDGVICEELIDGLHEYSYDHVSGLEWITEKKTTDGLYRAEYNHISPPKLTQEKYDLLIEAGRLVKKMIGSMDLACHIELFLNKDGTISCVEPNRRPAGGKVFSFGNHLFELPTNINVWDIWIDRALGHNAYYQSYDKLKKTVGFRFLRSFEEVCSKTEKETIENHILNIYQEYIEDLQLTFNKGEMLTNQLKTNAEFIGQVLVTHDNYEDINHLLDQIEIDINELIGNEKLRTR